MATVLVLEPDDLVQKAISSILGSLGFQILSFPDIHPSHECCGIYCPGTDLYGCNHTINQRRGYITPQSTEYPDSHRGHRRVLLS